jgi:vacuolar-type H+-ATPase subunit F/Vma7
MSEKKFGDTPLFEQKSWLDLIKEEMFAKGFKYAGIESLTTIKKGDDNIFREIPEQTMESIIARHKDLGEEVELVRDLRDSNSVLVFIKTK